MLPIRITRRARVLVLTGLVVVASFGEWGTYEGRSPSLRLDRAGASELPRVPDPVDAEARQGEEGSRPARAAGSSRRPRTFTTTGWRGTVGFFGLRLPNWGVPVSAILLAVCAVGRMPRGFRIHPFTPFFLAGYGALHLLHVTVVLASEGSVAAPLLVTVAGELLLIVAVLADPNLWPLAKREPLRPTGY